MLIGTTLIIIIINLILEIMEIFMEIIMVTFMVMQRHLVMKGFLRLRRPLKN